MLQGRAHDVHQRQDVHGCVVSLQNKQKTNDMKHEEHDYMVLIHLLPSLVNGIEYDTIAHEHYYAADYEKLKLFVAEHGEHWLPVFDDEFPDDLVQYMAKCDVTGEIGWCVEIKAT